MVTGQSGLGGRSTGLWFLYVWMAVLLESTIPKEGEDSGAEGCDREVNWSEGRWQDLEQAIVLAPDEPESEEEGLTLTQTIISTLTLTLAPNPNRRMRRRRSRGRRKTPRGTNTSNASPSETSP